MSVSRRLSPEHVLHSYIHTPASMCWRPVHCDRGVLWLSSWKHAEVVLMGRLCAVFMFATVELEWMFTAEHICPFIDFSLCCVCEKVVRSSPDFLTYLPVISGLQSWICSRGAKAEWRGEERQSSCYSNRIIKLDRSTVWAPSHILSLHHAVSPSATLYKAINLWWLI